MKQHYSIVYILDSPGNLNELFTFEDITLREELSGIREEEPSDECIRKILEAATR